MADGQFGGNGSVHWFVAPDTQGARLDVGNGPGNRRAHLGDDHKGNSPSLGQDFILRIKLPSDPPARSTFLQALRDAAEAALHTPGTERIETRLPIDKPPKASTQIQITWGADQGWYDGLSTLP